MNYKEFTGKTVEEAVEIGLKEMGLTEEKADIRVLEEGKKKLFGSVKARVEIAAKEEMPVEAAETKTVSNVCSEDATDGERTVVFLEGLFELLNITACTELVSEGDKVEINVTAANTTAIIGKHGAMLDAIQTLAGAVANTGRDDYKRVVVDCENYRENREATLNKLSENLAQKAIRLGKKIKLEPMNPYERRIIHTAVQAIDGVTSASFGEGINRRVVIGKEGSELKPLRNDRNRGRRDDRRRGGRRPSNKVEVAPNRAPKKDTDIPLYGKIN